MNRRGLLTSDYAALAAKLMSESADGVITLDNESIARVLQQGASALEIPKDIDQLFDELLALLTAAELEAEGLEKA
ncbi:MAG: hypothetical protein R8M38_05835 [Mariprofundaceae bacterium]